MSEYWLSVLRFGESSWADTNWFPVVGNCSHYCAYFNVFCWPWFNRYSRIWNNNVIALNLILHTSPKSIEMDLNTAMWDLHTDGILKPWAIRKKCPWVLETSPFWDFPNYLIFALYYLSWKFFTKMWKNFLLESCSEGLGVFQKKYPNFFIS